MRALGQFVATVASIILPLFWDSWRSGAARRSGPVTSWLAPTSPPSSGCSSPSASSSRKKPTAALVDDPNAVIEHKLYWGAVATRQEGMYLPAVLNSPYTTEVVRPPMSYGKDERDIDKAVWELPIPAFDPTDAKHARIAEIGEAEAQRIAELKFDDSKSYIQIRRTLRAFLLSSPDAEELDLLVTELLG
ncbi:hypothetical protein [Streptomyces afghaniensis]|uniref:hypothetical protein n=1 Tax=Streptomyces afghaniensis TaxID=66865 RepID=UPI00278B3248|nr:hypothetical protein [Streptomyces afghaniensis]MDQ1018847.1 hypothetical protein [Streptomyces afghaniensis]